MQPRYLGVFLLQGLQTLCQRVCDRHVGILDFVIMFILLIVERAFHLLDRGDDSLRFFRHLILFSRDQRNLFMKSL